MSQLRSGLELVAPAGAVPRAEIDGWTTSVRALKANWAVATTFTLTTASAVTFTWLSVVRHLAGGSHAEDLGFTDQVLWNFLQLQLQLHGQWFRTSIYQGATWNTELDVSRIARPDSLLAFHFEPMLVLLVPLYALGGGAMSLLVVQALALAAGAAPAYRLGHHLAKSQLAGVAVASAYLLSPLGQWAVLSDFHTSTLAAPLLLLAAERVLVARRHWQALIAAGLAATAREDVGPVLVLLGAALWLMDKPTSRYETQQVSSRVPTSRYAPAKLASIRPTSRYVPFVIGGGGVVFTVVAALVIHAYSGGITPFDVRYGATLGNGLGPTLEALARPSVLGYAATLVLSGGWLALAAPVGLLPALPTLALNALSTSPWMASGMAHYSALVLPFVVIGAAYGLARISRVRLASGALVLTSLAGYALQGGGPFGGNYAPSVLTDHAARAASIAASLPPDAAISASTSLVPRVSQRAHVYVFPAVEDADFIFIDEQASPAPTSAGDVYLRVQNLLGNGWHIATADDGLLLLARGDGSQPEIAQPLASTRLDPPSLVEAELIPSPDGAIDVDGPRWILRTVWRPAQPLPRGTRLAFTINLSNGEQLPVWDVADLWWNPPERWIPGKTTTVDVRDIPIRRFQSWQASWTQTQTQP